VTAICVSLTEATTEATLARMADLAPVADLFEIRADFVRDLDLPAVLRAREKPLLLTCRPRSEGGQWPDDDPEGRRAVLRQAVEGGVDLVDVEIDSGFGDVVAAKAGRGLVISHHDLAGVPGDLDALYDRMAATGADVVKIACTATSVSDAARLMAFCRSHASAPSPLRGLVALAMGPLGTATRILGGRHGAPFTFASPARGSEAAPGQVPARALAETYRVGSVGPDTRVYGILGSDIQRSLSPAIHNRAFAERGIDAVYVPLQAESLEAFLGTRTEMGLSGFSVTRPYKTEIVPRLDSVTPTVAESGSANTVVVQDGRLVGLSTDGDGILRPLRRRMDLADRRVCIVGAGGAARAAALALVKAGARVTVRARRSEQAAEVAAATGSTPGSLETLGEDPWDVRINATPVGSGAQPGTSPVRPAALRPGGLVFDMVYEPRETPLLCAAKAVGCRTVDGVEMLVAQAVGQFEAWTGAPAPVEAMTRAAHRALDEAEAASEAGS